MRGHDIGPGKGAGRTSGVGQTLFPSTFSSVTTDAAGHGAFNEAVQSLPAGRYLTALARGCSTTGACPR
jgi:hypothetical protein